MFAFISLDFFPHSMNSRQLICTFSADGHLGYFLFGDIMNITGVDKWTHLLWG